MKIFTPLFALAFLLLLGTGPLAAQSLLFERSIMVTDTVTDEGVTFEASSDDAEQENDAIDALFDDDLDAGWEGEPEDQNILTVGMRFRNIQLPRGAVIDSAYLVLTSHEGKSAEDVARITIYGEATDDAHTFTEDALITDRPATSASLLWEVAEPWEIWAPYRTPDLRDIIQEIVDRDGWQPGNSLAIILAGEDQGPSEVENAREFESYENIADPEDGGDGQNHPERRPRLVVFFSSGGTSAVLPLRADVRELNVYPNPAANGWVNIVLESEQPSIINLYNASGQLLRSQRYDFGQELRYDLGNLNGGMYFLQAVQDDKRYVQKLIVQE